MFIKKPKHRIFEYPPRYYKPETDEAERKKRKLGFSRQRKHIGKKRSPIIWIIFIFAVIYIFIKLQGI